MIEERSWSWWIVMIVDISTSAWATLLFMIYLLFHCSCQHKLPGAPINGKYILFCLFTQYPNSPFRILLLSLRFRFRSDSRSRSDAASVSDSRFPFYLRSHFPLFVCVFVFISTIEQLIELLAQSKPIQNWKKNNWEKKQRRKKKKKT